MPVAPHLLHFDLGHAPASGRDGLGQAFHFKGLLRNEIGSADGAWIEHVHDKCHVGLVVRYDPETRGAEDWAKRAVAWAPNIWERVSQAKERVVGRSA